MKYGLDTKTLYAIISEFEKINEIEKVVLYGSRAKGNFKPASDIDLVLQGKNISGTTLNKLSWALDDLLLPYTFDIAILHQIKHDDLLDHINRIGITIYIKTR